MGAKRKDENDRRERVTISMPKWLADKLKENKNYSKIVTEYLLTIYKKDK